MEKDTRNEYKDAYMVCWVDEEGNRQWAMPRKPHQDSNPYFIGRGDLMCDMVDVDEWIRKNLGSTVSNIVVAKVRKAVKVELTEQRGC